MPTTFNGSEDALLETETLYRSGIPADVAGIDEASRGVSEIMTWSGGAVLGMAREARISTAQGKYLDQHARDAGLARQADETDAALRERLRNPPEAITAGGILAAVSAIVLAAGGSLTNVRLICLPREGAYIAALGAEPAIASTVGRVRASLDRGARVNPPPETTTARFSTATSPLPSGRTRIVVVLIPAGLGIVAAVEDAVRAIILAGHELRVEEFTA